MAGFSNGLSAGVKNGNGKRERVDHEDDQEFMPLSKRINNIHLSPERLVNGGHSSSYLHTNGVPEPVIHHHPPHNGYHPGSMSQRQLSNGYSNNHHHQPNDFRGDDSTVQTSNFDDAVGGGRASLHSSTSEHRVNNYQNVPLSDVPVMPIHSSDLVTDSDFTSFHYRPSMNQNANPHYYEANRTLFELYIERQLRTNQAPHPNVFGTSSEEGVN